MSFWKWSRARLVLSIITCEGLFATWRERLQVAPGVGETVRVGVTQAAPQYYDYAGALHVHSTYSDGTGTVEEIADAANKAGLDFVILCDHSNLDARRHGQDGWQGRTLVLVGTELTTDTGHLLALDVPVSFLPASGNALKAQKAILETGGVGFIALPLDLKDHWRHFDRRIPNIGLEVFNLSAIARAKINLPALALVWRRYRSRRPQRAFHYVAARPGPELRLWDELIGGSDPGHPLQTIVGIASVDAHAVMRFGGRSFPYPTYEEVFRTLRTHVVTRSPLSHASGAVGGTWASDERADAALVYHAIADGRCYMSYDNYGDPTGFLFEAIPIPRGAKQSPSNSQSRPALMGESVYLDKADRSTGLMLRIRSPRRRSLVRLYHNGRLAAAARGGRLEHIVKDQGAYRVEVYLYRRRIGRICIGAKPWIFSNPIYVHPSSAELSQERCRNQSVYPDDAGSLEKREVPTP